MLEIRVGVEIDFQPTRWLMERGYRPYRLIPGLSALVPQDLDSPVAANQLNIFCCKPDRAERLRARGRLVTEPGPIDPPPVPPAAWPEFFRSLPFGRANVDPWLGRARTAPVSRWPEYERALNLYVLSRSEDQPVSARYDALRACLAALDVLLRSAGNPPRLLTYARAMADFGDKSEAAGALKYFIERAAKQADPLFTGEPFVPGDAEFEAVEPGWSLSDWMLASALDGYERFRTHSSYFSPNDTEPVTAELRRLGYCTPEMRRRELMASAIVRARADAGR
jgi:hypothetical protein